MELYIQIYIYIYTKSCRYTHTHKHTHPNIHAHTLSLSHKHTLSLKHTDGMVRGELEGTPCGEAMRRRRESVLRCVAVCCSELQCEDSMWRGYAATFQVCVAMCCCV